MFWIAIIIMLGSYFAMRYLKLEPNNETAFVEDSSLKIVEIMAPKFPDNYEENIRKKLKEIFVDKVINQNGIENGSKDSECSIHVKYTLYNDTYMICITDIDNLSKTSMSKITKIPRKIISAYLRTADNKHQDVTKELKMFQGPDNDFYKHLIGVSMNISDILYEYNLSQWNQLVIFDLFGLETIINISENVEINF